MGQTSAWFSKGDKAGAGEPGAWPYPSTPLRTALAQLDLQPQRLPGDLPGIFGQALSLRLGRGAHSGEAVAEAVSVF